MVSTPPNLSRAAALIVVSVFRCKLISSDIGLDADWLHRGDHLLFKKWGDPPDSKPQHPETQSWALPLSYGHQPAHTLVFRSPFVKVCLKTAELEETQRPEEATFSSCSNGWRVFNWPSMKHHWRILPFAVPGLVVAWLGLILGLNSGCVS